MGTGRLSYRQANMVSTHDNGHPWDKACPKEEIRRPVWDLGMRGVAHVPIARHKGKWYLHVQMRQK
jgi:hypothetical protein